MQQLPDDLVDLFHLYCPVDLIEKWASWTNEWARSGLQDPDDPKESDATDKAHNPQDSDDPEGGNSTDVTHSPENPGDSEGSNVTDKAHNPQNPGGPSESNATDAAHSPENSDDPDESNVTNAARSPDNPGDSEGSNVTDKAHDPQDPDESNVTDAVGNPQGSQTSETPTSSKYPWPPVTSAQILIWLAILINMGISPKRSLAEHWKTSQVGDIQPTDPFIKYMTFTRFREILKYLRIFPPFEKIEDDRERMTFRVREWSDHIRTTSTSLFAGSELQDDTERKKPERITKNRRKNNRLYQQFSRDNDHNDHLGGVDIRDHLRKDIGYNHRIRRGTWQAVT
ncbi:unnamed protein product [Clonostachys byssicola]|uniref:PiggyBac transposable element-derived protein domain-containing protein n=1 Tax=Clonostachys byssicola TaxID=160290 RepID=A0A9N9UUW0_9HYPO|nr:unnamed protein product [Clonostachys byssicola]